MDSPGFRSLTRLPSDMSVAITAQAEEAWLAIGLCIISVNLLYPSFETHTINQHNFTDGDKDSHS